MKKRRPHRLSKPRRGPHWYTVREIRSEWGTEGPAEAQRVRTVLLSAIASIRAVVP